MNGVTTWEVGTHTTDDRPTESRPRGSPRTAGCCWRNPPRGVRVVAVGAVWAIPGVLTGMLACILLHPAAAPSAAAAVGGLSFVLAGGCLEAFG